MSVLLWILMSLLLPACPTEDSASCFWDASTTYNGQGDSFWSDANGVPHYYGKAAS